MALLYLEERELNKEVRGCKRRGREEKKIRWRNGGHGQGYPERPGPVTWPHAAMSDKLKQKKWKPERSECGSWWWQNGTRGTQGQMEGGAAVRGEQMAAPDSIYEINNVSQIEFRKRNASPEF